LLEGAGFEIQDVFVDVSPEKIIQAISPGDVINLVIPALLTTTSQA
jgi:methanogenic corrinoid protein MtbC1